MAFNYRPSVLEQLARHGIIPGPETPPEMVHDFVNSLYLVEIRTLRDKRKAGLIPSGDYALRVAELRDRYPVLSLPLRFWTEELT
ncbi:MAG TPA: hypothetical protein VI756_22480 [Blastocatellia bacterium]